MTLPLGSPEFPREVMRGNVIGVGTRGCTGRMGGLTWMGVNMDMADMDDRPIDRFGIEPIPVGRKNTEHEEVKRPFFREIRLWYKVL